MTPGRWIGVIGVGVGVALGAAVPGQSQTAAPSTLDALLAEVRGLRGEVHQAAGASIRTQLLVARLSLQEQRINGVAKQLTDVQTQRAAIEGPTAQFDQRFNKLEELLRSPSTPPDQRHQMEQEFESMKLVRTDMRQRLQRLVNQETAFSSQLATEQSRWVEFNDRLDQIEREIAAAMQQR
jgi:predicted  nucleic acid-binding Zn-ribbon protein